MSSWVEKKGRRGRGGVVPVLMWSRSTSRGVLHTHPLNFHPTTSTNPSSYSITMSKITGPSHNKRVYEYDDDSGDDSGSVTDKPRIAQWQDDPDEFFDTVS